MARSDVLQRALNEYKETSMKITIRLELPDKLDVKFEGDWNGKFLRKATDYTLREYKRWARDIRRNEKVGGAV